MSDSVSADATLGIPSEEPDTIALAAEEEEETPR